MKKLDIFGFIAILACMIVAGFTPTVSCADDITCENLHVTQDSQLNGQLSIGPDIKIKEEVDKNLLRIDTGEIPGADGDRRDIVIPCSANDGGQIVISPSTSSIFKEGGDEWFGLGEESHFNSIVDVGHLSVEGSSWQGWPFVVNTWGQTGDWLRVARFYSPNIPNGRHVTMHLGKSDSDKNSAEISYFHAGDNSLNNRLCLGVWGNAETINILRSGSVGIGITNPDSKLQVNGTVRSEGFSNSNGTAGQPSYRFQADSNTGMYLAGGDMLAFTTGGAEKLRIGSNGNVGIGTTGPRAKLDAAQGGVFNQVAVGSNPFGSLPYPYESIQLPSWANLRLNFGSKETVFFENRGDVTFTGPIHGTVDAAGWADEAETAEYAFAAGESDCTNGWCHVAEMRYVVEDAETLADGDVVCLEQGKIVKSREKNSRGVRGVIEYRLGKPMVIVAGLYQINVIGPVKCNDLLVTSEAPGYAMANNDAKIGTVIAKADEDFTGEKGVISCYIQGM
ncbi:MAG: hypothetical protein NTZ78_01465 [Candidatus Aureabacteria bacterium]|nr:hypothetical protein [Candidatus Auribacterota bacterium]